MIMAGDTDLDGLAEQLRQLPLGQLLDVLRRVMPRHTQQSGRERTVLALARASTDDTEALVELVAWPDQQVFAGFVPPHGLYQSGHCPRCRVALVGNVKSVRCPVCNAERGLT